MMKHFVFIKLPVSGTAPSQFYARCLPLGLTAYGNSKQEAKEHLKTMFNKLVDLESKQESHG